jgi:hypothetical protein
MEQILQHDANMHNVASHLLGGLLVYEGDCMNLIISELVIKNNGLKGEYRTLVNAEQAKHRGCARGLYGSNEEEPYAHNDDIRRIELVKVYVD